MRLHPLTQPDRTSFYVWDFGDYVGNFLKEVDKAFYFRILNDKQTYFEYSVVPKNPCTCDNTPGRRYSCASRLLPGSVGWALTVECYDGRTTLPSLHQAKRSRRL